MGDDRPLCGRAGSYPGRGKLAGATAAAKTILASWRPAQSTKTAVSGRELRPWCPLDVGGRRSWPPQLNRQLDLLATWELYEIAALAGTTATPGPAHGLGR